MHWRSKGKLLWASGLLVGAIGCAGAPVTAAAGGGSALAARATTVVVVRHAERADDDPSDPSLSSAGRGRAEALRATLAGSDVAAIYATQYRRTRDTGAALAEAVGVPVTVRPIEAASAATYATDLARAILGSHTGRTVVVIGHSNTVPELVKALGGGEVEPMPESEYDRMYVLVIDGADRVRLVAASYGAATG